MYRRDYILNEARKFAQLVARLMGLKSEGLETEFEQEFNAAMQREYDTSAGQLLSLTEADFTPFITQATYSAEQLNALGQLLYLYAQPLKADGETGLLLKKVLIIFDLLEQKHHFQTLENLEKRKQILQFLTNIHHT